MYYWNKVTENKTTLEEELLELEAVNEVYIGTAFFSSEGLRILKEIIAKYKLKKNRVKIYLSSEFSQDKPHELLEGICPELCGN